MELMLIDLILTAVALKKDNNTITSVHFFSIQLIKSERSSLLLMLLHKTGMLGSSSCNPPPVSSPSTCPLAKPTTSPSASTLLKVTVLYPLALSYILFQRISYFSPFFQCISLPFSFSVCLTSSSFAKDCRSHLTKREAFERSTGHVEILLFILSSKYLYSPLSVFHIISSSSYQFH